MAVADDHGPAVPPCPSRRPWTVLAAAHPQPVLLLLLPHARRALTSLSLSLQTLHRARLPAPPPSRSSPMLPSSSLPSGRRRTACSCAGARRGTTARPGAREVRQRPDPRRHRRAVVDLSRYGLTLLCSFPSTAPSSGNNKPSQGSGFSSHPTSNPWTPSTRTKMTTRTSSLSELQAPSVDEDDNQGIHGRQLDGSSGRTYSAVLMLHSAAAPAVALSCFRFTEYMVAKVEEEYVDPEPTQAILPPPANSNNKPSQGSGFSSHPTSNPWTPSTRTKMTTRTSSLSELQAPSVDEDDNQGIHGRQLDGSSGKSTLLNQLFGTNFTENLLGGPDVALGSGAGGGIVLFQIY
ncbi:uncharacterized protein [Triticum aestivum]|uniref:uncharacterized protein isoform X2 n=1 Tax=Triticum aestivum TaxID=4565 RepID=UPI001D01B155|nr:uncharacterized protein LOC123169409 isoform X2 [Triticum aestivum]XP_044443201.1 uncharacterized protein LOC123169409 isoform X2 [Triticum aestivum]XP_044443202.1 uncharacterized protein LOC123169409 isoform X2 [Triticum aestivum]XP_044443204.1 uncharacterized protein LOC123169409 isoform X2 [Triticum aestivum]XP_044443205.1 uncharacterized protein LOC123169409 isoform X2 [Triticum aestivum]XP_044443206.1 uncharacterized protein LOC123169409 isoform X2 [Triticum aestivum]XP_044443207.1 un